MDKKILYVISVISNPLQYETRYALFNEFIDRIKNEGNMKLMTIELQNGNRPFLTDSSIKLRTNSIVWSKENLINVVVNHLPDDWKYMAWVDSDIEFQNKNWVNDTINELEIYKVVQLFSHAIDMGPKKGNVTRSYRIRIPI